MRDSEDLLRENDDLAQMMLDRAQEQDMEYKELQSFAPTYLADLQRLEAAHVIGAVGVCVFKVAFIVYKKVHKRIVLTGFGNSRPQLTLQHVAPLMIVFEYSVHMLGDVLHELKPTLCDQNAPFHELR